jgi:hypothetical protein
MSDWRESAHLNAENWPECIPEMFPKREYGPYAWGEPRDEYDNYPWSHPDAGSISGRHMGDVCPMCGKPLRIDETVVNKDGSVGDLIDVSSNRNPVPCYHKQCWRDRQETKGKAENSTLGEFA